MSVISTNVFVISTDVFVILTKSFGIIVYFVQRSLFYRKYTNLIQHSSHSGTLAWRVFCNYWNSILYLETDFSCSGIAETNSLATLGKNCRNQCGYHAHELDRGLRQNKNKCVFDKNYREDRGSVTHTVLIILRFNQFWWFSTKNEEFAEELGLNKRPCKLNQWELTHRKLNYIPQ